MSAANATRSAVTVMTSERDSILLIFLEGKQDKGNVLVRENFRSGAVRIAKACQEKRPEQNWPVLPVDVQYITDQTTAP